MSLAINFSLSNVLKLAKIKEIMETNGLKILNNVKTC
jgi:hypothetical protein